MLKVLFITVEHEELDMIVSFALGEHAETSLTLLRTPSYEHVLDEWERGVSVGTGSRDGQASELLVGINWLNDQAVVTSSLHEYRLDLAAVDHEEIDEAKALLELMNFDSKFQIHAA